MLEALDLALSLSKEEFKKKMDGLERRMGEMQRKARELGIPIIVVFEGWDAAGKGTMINNLMLALDPRGFKVYPIGAPTQEELLRPWLWRFWIKTPEKGRIVIFDRSWYGKVLVERIDNIVNKKEIARAYEEINAFEHQLTDDKAVVIKFFLHISKKEQAKRFKRLAENKATAWKVTDDDRRHHKQYTEYAKAIEEMLERTDTGWAPWHLIESHDRRHAVAKVFSIIADTLERTCESETDPVLNTAKKTAVRRQAIDASSPVLQKADLDRSLTRVEYEKSIKDLQEQMNHLEHEIYTARIPVVIAYEGWDAAGKGGNIKRLVRGMDPRGFEVVPVAAPTPTELRHHYLWRFWNEVPKAGHITIFDRSWYGRVLVERVEGFCTEKDWRRAYQEINEMEEHWTRFGMVVIKFWLQISRQEQLRRFKERQRLTYKQWKITEEDWRNREKWNVYEMAVNEMILRTDTAHSPWTIVEANDKLYARVKTLRTAVDRIKEALKNR